MNARRRGQVLVTLLIVLAFVVNACSSGSDKAVDRKPQYVAPAEGTPSLVDTLTTSRDSLGHLLVAGRTLLPEGATVSIELYKGRKLRNALTEQKVQIGANGGFELPPLEVPSVGLHTVQVIAYFNEIWQSESVLALVGRNGTLLPRSALTPDDEEFPEQGGRLQETRSVELEALQPAAVASREAKAQADKAMRAVKRAKLFVKGKGMAVDTVEEIVQYMSQPGLGFSPGEWSATSRDDGTWTVSLHHQWGTERKVANWEYSPSSGKVRYLNAEAKMLSWIPAE